MDSATKLLPCPFCGASGSVYREHCTDGSGVFLTVKCHTCGAKCGEKYHSYGNDCPQTYQEVRDKWNTRALHAENAALRKAADELAAAADALWMEAHQNMTGGKGHLLDDVVVTLSAYRAARGDT